MWVGKDISLFAVSFTTASAPPTPTGGGNSGGPAGGVATTDQTPPASPTKLTIHGANRQAILNWENPADPDFVRVLVLRSALPLPPNPPTGGNPRLLTQAQVAYDGVVPSFTDVNLVNGQLYRYTLYAYDRSGNYSPPVTLAVTPSQVGSTVVLPSASTPPAPPTAKQSLLLQLYRELLKLLQQLLALLLARGR